MANDSLLGQMGADSLPEDEVMVNADEALAEEISTALQNEENGEEFSGTLASSIVRTVQDRYQESQRSRDVDERRWTDAYSNFRGKYAKNIKFTEREKSRVFVKVTKTKVLAGYGQLIDVLFGANKFPISIRATKVPEGAAEYTHFKMEGAPDAETGAVPVNAISTKTQQTPIDPYAKNNMGYPGDGRDIHEEVRTGTVGASLGLDMEIPEEEKAKFVEGPSKAGEPQFKPAEMAAQRMEKLIHDQIEESNGTRELRSALFEASLLGTGIIKGPFTTEKTLHRWTYDPETKERTYTPEKVKVPRIEFCSVFDAFNDPNANTMEDSEWFIQRHKLSRSQVRGLKNRPYFRTAALNQVLRMTPNYVNQDYEQQLIAENTSVVSTQDRYEVLEYWGLMDRADLIQAGITDDMFDKADLMEEVQVNVWICAGKLLRVVLNPFTPKRIPYLAFDYEKNPYSFFGVGIAENMEDSQKIMNGHMRMAIDNLALAGNLVFDVDENALTAGQDMEIYPGKIFKRASGVPGQSIYGIKFPNTAPENMQIFDKFRQIADESTGIPSIAHGQTGISPTTRTAAGMSMIMGASSLPVKTVVVNIDDDLLKPLGEAFFQWNMSFYEGDLDIVGDLEVKAGGANSLMQEEIKSQRLTAFGQLFSNPAVAPFIKIPAYVREFVMSLGLDPDELINDEDQAKVYAAIMGQAGGLGPMGAPPQQGADSGMGQTGGVPAPAMPGGDGFSGNTGAMPDMGEGV